MKVRSSIWTRCVALVLVLMMVISSANLGAAFQVLAESEHSVNVGSLIADNYDLSAAEEALLNSGYLTNEKVTYKTLPEGLVSVDKNTTTIHAESAKGWVPTTAVLTYGENTKTIDISGGTYVYNAAELGNAFNVLVNYKYETTDVSVETQSALLGAAAILKQGYANTQAVAAQSGNLYILEEAMPALVDLANTGVQTSFTTVKLSDACKAAIAELDAQTKENDGKLDLNVMIEEYESGSKIGYLVTKGAAMQAEVASLYENTKIISTALNTIYENIGWLIEGGFVSETVANNIKTLAGVCKNLVVGLETVNNDPWTAANTPNLLVKDGDAVLDTLVAALGEETVVTPKESLLVATDSQQFNMSMYNVVVSVVLQTTQDNEVKEKSVKTDAVTLVEGATAADIEAAVLANGVEAAAIIEWGIDYVDGQFEKEVSELPATLTEDITYTITYSPKYYKVTSNYADEASYPYGYELVLPVHEDAEKAYDYKVNGVSYAQGAKVIIDADTDIQRTAGKAYTSGNLYNIVAGNFMVAGSKGYAILTSGALNGNEAVNVRYPGAEDAETLLLLLDGKLTAAEYEASYEDLYWAPYSYGTTGTENLFSGSTAAWDGKDAKIIYRLDLTNYTQEQVAQILANAKTLADEADAQKVTLDALASYHDTMGQLDKTKLGALNGVIDVTDFTPDDGTDTDAKNLELRAYFKGVVSAIIANNLDSNNYLKIYNMLTAYKDENTGGLRYYYNNSAAMINEINMLSEYLGKLTAEEEALRIMVGAAGFPEYAEKITDLEKKITEVKNSLTAPNARIDLNSANLGKLIDALETEADVTYTAATSPWLTSVALTALDESQRNIQVIVQIPSKNVNKGFTTDPVDRGTIVTNDVITGLTAEINAFVAGNINADLYNVTVSTDAEGKNATDDVTTLVGKALDDTVIVYYTYTAKQFTIEVPGGDDAVVTVENKEINLPVSGEAAAKFVYTLVDGDGNVVRTVENGGTITLDEVQFALLVAGNLSIEKTVIDLAVSALEEFVAALNTAAGAEVAVLVEENGAFVGIHTNVTTEQLMNVVMAMATNSQYTYVGLNGNGLKYMENDVLEICMQTLIDAILLDEDFSNDAVIKLCEAGSGKLFKASMQLGNAADELVYEDMEFVMNVSGLPAQLKNNVDLIKTISNYIQFYSEGDKLKVEVTLPDQVYGAYAAALIAAGYIDKSDVNGMDNAVAVAFVVDYVNAVLGSEMDTETYTNTLAMLGLNKDLTVYEQYYGMTDYITITAAEGEAKAAINVDAEGKVVIDKLMALAGMEIEATILSQIKEYKAGGSFVVNTDAVLTNPDKTYMALIVDLEAAGASNKFQAPSSYAKLAAETKTLAGKSAMILLSDVDGDLVINGTTVLDLNGKNINGNIHATGTLYIIDSSMGTYNAGKVSGHVSGNVTIISGNYGTNVNAFLKDGYYMDGQTVRNALYYIKDEAGTVTFVINADVYENEHVNGVVPNYKALAIDIATDLMLNYANTAKLSVGGYELIGMHIEDVVGLYADDNKVKNLVNQLLACVTIGEAGYENNAGFEGVVNMILADLLDFGAISAALAGDGALATYDVATEPWTIEIAHVNEGDKDYATVNITSNEDLKKEFKVALIVESKYNEKLSALTGELANIVVADETFAEVDIPTPTFSNKTLTVKGNAQANFVVDMSQNEAYPVMMAVILANGNPAKRAAVAAAINDVDGVNMAALKKVIDNTTVAEIFTALKALNRGESFAAMAKKVGVTADVTAAGELEAIYHTALCGMGKALEELDITGMNSKLGNLYNAETGWYELGKSDIFRDKEFTARGYSALIELGADELLLKVKLFGEVEEVECLWGDADHDGDVDQHDASLVFEYFMKDGNIDQEICLIRTDVDQDGDVDNHDASIIFEYFMYDKTNELPEGSAN